MQIQLNIDDLFKSQYQYQELDLYEDQYDKVSNYSPLPFKRQRTDSSDESAPSFSFDIDQNDEDCL